MNDIMKHIRPLTILVPLFACLLITACAVPAKRAVTHEDPRALYGRAVEQEKAGNSREAYQSYVSVWKLFPGNNLAPEALYRAGTLASAGSPEKAADHYRSFLSSYPDSPLQPKAARALLQIEIGLARHDKALELFGELFRESRDPSLVQTGIRLVRQLSGAGRCPEALTLVSTMFPAVDKPSQETLIEPWKACVAKTDQVERLVELEQYVHDARLLDVLLARQVELYLAQDRQDEASRVISRLGPGRGLSQWRNSLSAGEKKTIGVLVPLSGKWESVGSKVLKGIQFASRVFSREDPAQVEYLIRDYGEDEQSIASIIEDLDTREDVVALIGPIGESAGSIACREARMRGIPAFLFTRAEVVPDQASYCFSNFISIDIQSEALLRTAADMNIHRFAIFHPNDVFGNSFAQSFTDRAPQHGVSVVRTIGYSSDLVDFKEAVQKLVEHLSENEPPDFDALLIPDSAINAAMVASYLPYLNIKGVRLFGPSLWDSPDFLRVGGRYVEGAVFVSGFFAGSQLDYVQEFNDEFYYTFGYNPSVWEASACDTATILQNLLNGSSPSRETLRELISSLEDYPGLTGSTSFSPDGSVEKIIYVLTIRNAAAYEIAP